MSELLSEVDRAASGSESPELVMYWHKKTVVDHDMAASDLQTRIEATPRCDHAVHGMAGTGWKYQ